MRDVLRLKLFLQTLLLFCFLNGIFSSSVVYAQAPSMTTFQARIIKPDGLSLEAASVNFTMTYRSHDGACTLYVERFSNISMTGSKGLVALQMGDGVKIYPSTAATVQGVFDNAPLTPHRCLNPLDPTQDIGTYSTMTASSGRILIAQFDDKSGTGAQTIAGITINSAPYAWFSKVAGLSHDSEKLNGFSASQFLQWADVQASSCSPGQFLTYDSSGTPKLTCSSPAAQGYSSMTSADVVNALTYTPLAPATQFSGDVTGTYNTTSVTKIRGVPVDAAAATPTSGDVLRYDGTKYIATALPSAPVASVAGKTGVVNLVSSDITGLGAAAGMNVGTAAGTVAAGNDARFTDARAPMGAASGDLSGTYPNPSVVKIQGRAVTLTSIASGDILQYNGSGFVNRNIPTCGANEYLTFNGTAYSCVLWIREVPAQWPVYRSQPHYRTLAQRPIRSSD